MNLVEIVRYFCLILGGFSVGSITNALVRLYVRRPKGSVMKDSSKIAIPNWLVYMLRQGILRAVRCNACGVEVHNLADHGECPTSGIVFADKYGWTVRGPEPERTIDGTTNSDIVASME